ncbi:MAG: acyl carrier protein [Erysipelotrichaceae bacterium]|nr:acyl carrier protein [Erysipelotrichaceae bacterium]MBR5795549.1 acyl carrier protein [Erysipelotrichaceae bacterium]
MDNLNLIVKLLKDYVSDEIEITRESTLKELQIDSLDLVEVVVSAEEQTGVTFEDDELVDLKTVGDVVDLLNKKTN